MTLKDDSEQIEHLALKGVGGRPNGNGGVDARILARDTNLQAQPLGSFDREQVIHNLEARFLGVKVQRCDVREETELEPRLIAEKFAGPDEMGRPNVERYLTAESARIFNRLRVIFLQFLESQIVS